MSEEIKQIAKGQEPFTTQDQELALSLLTAGCRFADPTDGGPAQMHYSPDICRNRWVTKRDVYGSPYRAPLLSHQPVSPEQFELAVMRAVQMKIPGVVTYYIVRDDIFREAIGMHDKLANEAAAAARENRAMDIPSITTMSEAQAAMVVCYIRRMNQKDMAGYGWVRSPNLALGDVKKTVNKIEGAPTELLEQMSFAMHGTGKIWSLDLPDEKRATIMSDGKPFIHPKPRL